MNIYKQRLHKATWAALKHFTLKHFRVHPLSKRILFCCVRSHFRHLLNSFTNCIEHNTYCTAWMQQTGMEGDVDSRNVHDDVVLQLGHVNSRTRRVASTRWCVVAIHPDWCCLLLVVGCSILEALVRVLASIRCRWSARVRDSSAATIAASL